MKLKALEMLAGRIEQEAIKEFAVRTQFRHATLHHSKESAHQDWCTDQYWGNDEELRETCIDTVIDRLFDKE